MKAIILAGGQAKRLKSITDNKPKCLLRINEKSIIDYQIKALKKNNIKEIIIVVGFQAKKLMQYLTKIYPEINFVFIKNKIFNNTNAAYSLWLAKKYLINSVIYLNSDVLCDPNIIRKIIESKKKCITAIQRISWDKEEVNVIINKNSQIIKIGKDIDKKNRYGEFIGVTKLSKEFNQKLISVLDNLFISNKNLKKFAADAINLTIQNSSQMYILDVTHLPAIEIDTIKDYERAKKLWENK